MECKNKHFRHILLFYFRKGKKAAEATSVVEEEFDNALLDEEEFEGGNE